MLLTDRGVLTKDDMLDMLRPGALDAQLVAGRRIRWAYRATRGDEKETRRVAEELKALHLKLGAQEVLIHSAPSSAPSA
jgi:hypothetical protein